MTYKHKMKRANEPLIVIFGTISYEYSPRQIREFDDQGFEYEVMSRWRFEARITFQETRREIKDLMECCAAFFLRYFVNPPLALLVRVLRRGAR